MTTARQRLRRKAICDIIARTGGAIPATNVLAKHFDVRPETIRKDLVAVDEMLEGQKLQIIINTLAEEAGIKLPFVV